MASLQLCEISQENGVAAELRRVQARPSLSEQGIVRSEKLQESCCTWNFKNFLKIDAALAVVAQLVGAVSGNRGGVLPVQFPVRAYTQVVVSFPSPGVCRKATSGCSSLAWMFLFLPLSLKAMQNCLQMKIKQKN